MNGILDRDTARVQTREIRELAGPVLRKVVDEAAGVFERCSQTAKDGDENLGILMPLHHAIEMLDGVAWINEKCTLCLACIEPCPVDAIIKKESDIAVFFQTECSSIKLPPLAEVQALHIIQESLTNIRKHSQAEHVRILIRCDNEYRYHVLIEDDGIGIDATTMNGQPGEHVGLTIMQERARRIGAEVIIESEPGEGTRIEFDINCSQQPGWDNSLEQFSYCEPTIKPFLPGE